MKNVDLTLSGLKYYILLIKFKLMCVYFIYLFRYFHFYYLRLLCLKAVFDVPLFKFKRKTLSLFMISIGLTFIITRCSLARPYFWILTFVPTLQCSIK